MEWRQGEYAITDERSRADLDVVAALLRDSYWAWWRPDDMIARSLEGSLCFSLLHRDRLVGFTRVVTDRTTFAWIADVIIHPDYRGRGLGKWLMTCVVEHPELRETQMILKTRDAHTFYAQFGFEQDTCMRRRSPLYPTPSDDPSP
jgi:GNAT superfamily N-acetyltransferase